LFLGLGCLVVTAYVYTQSKMTAKESQPVILQNRTEPIHPMVESQREPLFFKPYHIMVIRIHSPLSYFNVWSELNQDDYKMDDEVATAISPDDDEDAWYSTSTESTTTATPDSSESSPTTSSWYITGSTYLHPVNWFQDQLDWFQGQMNWIDRNLGFGMFNN